jgi:hypothetical protein
MKPNVAAPPQPNDPTRFTTYPRHTAEALHALAESNPTPQQYREAKERILAGTRR